MSHVRDIGGAEDPALSVLTQEVWATGTRLSNALRLENYFRHLSQEGLNLAKAESSAK